MRPLRIRHRPDGVIELRRRHLHDALVAVDAAILLAMMLGCMGFIALVTATLVASPFLLTIPGAIGLFGVWAGAFARKTRLEPASEEGPPPAA